MAKVFLSYEGGESFANALGASLRGLGHVTRLDVASSSSEAIPYALQVAHSTAEAWIVLVTGARSQCSSVLQRVRDHHSWGSGRHAILPVVVDDAEIPTYLRALPPLRVCATDPASVAAEIAQALDALAEPRRAIERAQREKRQREVETRLAELAAGSAPWSSRLRRLTTSRRLAEYLTDPAVRLAAERAEGDSLRGFARFLLRFDAEQARRVIHAYTFQDGPIRHDPIEDAPELAEAFEAVEEELSRSFTTLRRDDGHRIWRCKKALLGARGIDWLALDQLSTTVIAD